MNAWYSSSRAIAIYQNMWNLLRAREARSKAQINVEKIKANKKVKVANEVLQEEL